MQLFLGICLMVSLYPEVVIMSVVQLQLKKTSYTMKITTYRRWESKYPMVEPTSRSGVSFRGMTWNGNTALVIA